MTIRTTWTAPKDLLQEAEQLLTEVVDPPVDATSLMRDDDASAEPEDAPWILHAYTEDPISDEVLGLLPEGLSTPQAEKLEDRDWVAHALEGLGIVRAGPFVLFGSHDAEKVSGGDGIPLQVEANQAFGTGHHPTTAGCLDAIGELRERHFSSILDVGCGSGILAMAARKIWAPAVIVASDIDPRSVEIAIENAGVNRITDIHFEVAAGTGAEAAARYKPFDLIFANILAGPLRELAPDIAAHAAPGAVVVLAGLLDEQQADVERAYRSLGFDVLSVGGTPRWPVLTLQRR